MPRANGIPMDEFKRELRYYVLKIKDVAKYLTHTEQQILNSLANKCATERYVDKRGILDCVCVERDWPEYDNVWKMIERRVAKEQKQARKRQRKVK